MHDDGNGEPTPWRPTRAAALKAWIGALDAIRILEDTPDAMLPVLLDNLADTYGDRPALVGECEQVSYRELAAQANRVARWGTSQGLAAGSVVCLLMRNCPGYVAIWLGLARTGCIVALINTNLVDDALLYSIRAAGSAHVIVAASLWPAVAAVADRLAPNTQIWVHGDVTTSNGQHVESEISCYNPAPLSPTELALPSARDGALLIYTSGTTGLPKAARVTHRRIVEWSFWFAGMMNVQSKDRLYDCLPLYHSTGGVVAIGAMLVRGGSVLIRERFSATRFWDDVVDGDCTIFQYIGELCRYLVASPPHPREEKHRLRLACGNGLQRDVWGAFTRRFKVAQILEFYAATEGSVSLYNCEGKPGAIGRIPPFLAQRFPVGLLRCDAETGMPLRDDAGLCIACGSGEVGEAVGQVLGDAHSPARQFDGYTDEAASARKLLHNVFVPGDCWFRTGDLMRRDAQGYFYFVDRIGDTFRWKGENVASTEVVSVLCQCPGVTDAVVYGVPVPGHEGRAGMAAITTDERFDLSNLRALLAARLPTYAQPLFVRITAALDVTGTFKLAKGRLAQEGYAEATDPIWFNDRETGQLISCDEDLLRSIHDGTRRL
jgi:fatty-acyl-CoA synthase